MSKFRFFQTEPGEELVIMSRREFEALIALGTGKTDTGDLASQLANSLAAELNADATRGRPTESGRVPPAEPGDTFETRLRRTLRQTPAPVRKPAVAEFTQPGKSEEKAARVGVNAVAQALG